MQLGKGVEYRPHLISNKDDLKVLHAQYPTHRKSDAVTLVEIE